MSEQETKLLNELKFSIDILKEGIYHVEAALALFEEVQHEKVKGEDDLK